MRVTQKLTRLLLVAVCVFACSCSNPQPGPDKTFAGMLLGAGWGAGTGAVIGHQVSYTGEGLGIGAGFGAVSGMFQGIGYDLAEGSALKMERQLASLRVQNIATSRELNSLQTKLDRAITAPTGGGIYQVFFDEDATNLRTGSIADLEVIADSIKGDPRAYVINVVGHADDAGSPEYNERLAESRARAVSSYLAARGISVDQIVVRSFGSQRPIVSNTSQTGRQLNRRVDVYLSR